LQAVLILFFLSTEPFRVNDNRTQREKMFFVYLQHTNKSHAVYIYNHSNIQTLYHKDGTNHRQQEINIKQKKLHS